jgi:hypothetical protein
VGLRHSFSSRASFSFNFTTRFAAITICLEINSRGYMPGNEGTLLFPHARAYSHTVSYEERDERKPPLFLSIWTPRHPIRLRLSINPSGPYLMIYKMYFRRDVPVNRPPKTGCR